MRSCLSHWLDEDVSRRWWLPGARYRGYLAAMEVTETNTSYPFCPPNFTNFVKFALLVGEAITHSIFDTAIKYLPVV